MHFQNCKKAGGKETKKLYNFYKKGKIGAKEEKTGRIDKQKAGWHNTSIETIVDLWL